MGKWETVRLGDVCSKIASGKNKQRSDSGQYTIYGSTGIIGYSDIYAYDYDTVLVARVGANCGFVHVAMGNYEVSDNTLIIDPKNGILDLKYAYFQLKNLNLNQYSKGAGQPLITAGMLKELQIPLPPLPIQQQIADILDRSAALIEKRKTQIAKLDVLVKSRFVEMFGFNRFDYVDLISLIIDGAGLSYGIVQPGDDRTGDMGVLRPVDLINGGISTTEIKYIDKKIGDGYKRTELTGEELLITVRGTTGITALSDVRFGGMNVTRGIAVIRYNSDIINPIYLNEYLKSDESQWYIQENTKGIALKQINLSDLKQQPIPLPPLDLQNRFADFVRAADKSKLEMQRGLDKLELLYKSLMQKCFNGERYLMGNRSKG